MPSLLNRTRGREVEPALREELDREPPWMYAWELAPGVKAPTHAPPEREWFATGVHTTTRDMIEAEVRAALDRAGPDATAIDLACYEGWFSHRLLEWGASRVVAVDIREVNIRRARLIADHFQIGSDRIDFRLGDVFELDVEALGQFDVVLNLGLTYHLEDPVGAMRVSRALCGDLCAIDTQLTRQPEPIEWGLTEHHQERAAGSFAATYEQDTETNPVAARTGILSPIPNAAAVHETCSAAGFASSEQVEPEPLSDPRYISGDRGVFLARVR